MDIFKDKAPEVITPMFIGQGLGALCIVQHCCQKRDKIELEGDCMGLLAKWINATGAQLAGMTSILTNDTQSELVSVCAELCEKGIKSKCCDKR